MTSDLETYFDALSTADAARAVGVLDAATERGVPSQRLIREVLVPAQLRVGEQWFTGSWSVADEHAATAVSEQALSLLCPPARPRASALRTVVACAEGEWHTLPARFAAELTRTGDVDVLFLGGSLPAEALERHLRATGADVLLLSCTMPTNLLGAARGIEVAHAVGLPVVVGGRAWGQGQHRAQRLGADLHLNDPGQLRSALAHLPTRLPLSQVPVEVLLLDVPPRELLVLALDRHRAADRWMRQMTPFQVNRSLEDLCWLARHAAAAVACGDPTVVGDLLHWLLELLTPRGVPGAAVLDSCDYLADAVEPDAPQAAEVLRSQAAAVCAEAGA